MLGVTFCTCRMPGPHGEGLVLASERGTLDLDLYAPRSSDPQTPHTRDELYIVVTGSGQFANGPMRHAFGPIALRPIRPE